MVKALRREIKSQSSKSGHGMLKLYDPFSGVIIGTQSNPLQLHRKVQTLVPALRF
jgi:hypothetical protein